MLTLSIIKADTGGFVGHSAMHPDMLAVARAELEQARGDLLVDAQVSSCGDDLHLVMTHRHGPDAAPVHELSFPRGPQARRAGATGAAVGKRRRAALERHSRHMGGEYAEPPLLWPECHSALTHTARALCWLGCRLSPSPESELPTARPQYDGREALGLAGPKGFAGSTCPGSPGASGPNAGGSSSPT